MRLILMGAPGAGKGTQADRLASRFDVTPISTGNILRDARNNRTALGLKAEEFMARGLLVPDDVVIGIVSERVREKDCARGFLLDGFPRTVAQAEALDGILGRAAMAIDRVVCLDVSDEEVVGRLSGRRTCSGCGETFHVVFKRPKVDAACDKCGSGLVQRTDDREEAVRERMRVYRAQTEPVMSFYRARSLLTVVDGTGALDDVTRRLFDALAPVDKAARQ